MSKSIDGRKCPRQDISLPNMPPLTCFLQPGFTSENFHHFPINTNALWIHYWNNPVTKSGPSSAGNWACNTWGFCGKYFIMKPQNSSMDTFALLLWNTDHNLPRPLNFFFFTMQPFLSSWLFLTQTFQPPNVLYPNEEFSHILFS